MKLAKLHQKEEFSKDLAKIQKICRNRLFTSHPGAVTADCFRTAVSCAWTKCRASFFVFTILASALSAECLAEPAGQPQAWVYVYSFSMMALNNRSHVAGGVLCQDYSGSHLHVGWRSTGSGRAGSVAMAHGPSRSAACGIFPDRGTNPCPLHRQADSQPLHQQGSPRLFLEGTSEQCSSLAVRGESGKCCVQYS
ncbi:uncharacterized protein LOC112393140 isoform X2 [Neophocaena asiaeorientalis asiaeorientalis]|nr:uncharacterized protein LOC112393140 isoform X2 [Neophocaena asiaeorientalis asiaeorientalis]XP_024590987.1 uncharacterized protein LOC112393140 isoform X2 [Neophocaena asiaeorientalis asiaeorientalis]XP_024590988.1 uncharacterized protein LOC112393140 isoform X2 [Neophocaena asiaeorientalis asiaeorientalis]